jgi:signal transduction histidine kinase/DNA-binding response OmpR family regulator
VLAPGRRETAVAPDEPIPVLVVDDLADKRLALETALEGTGVLVVPADSGREALRQLLTRDFAVILLDVNMPGMDGFETAALIRARPRSQHTPIIFITGYGDEVHAVQGYSLGAVDYILSPVIPTVLRTKVGVFVELYRKTQQIRRQAEQEVALAREQAARAAAEEATRRSTFLSEASTVLANSLNLEATARALLNLAVPRLGDLAGVTIVESPGDPWQTALAWACDPDQPPHTTTLAADTAPHDALRDAIDRVLADGRPEVLAVLDVPYPPAAEPAPAPACMLHDAVVLPLFARGRTLGVLTLAMGPSCRAYSPSDLALAEELAGRAAVALDNARLYREIQEADRRKDEFLALLGHELRNPLAPIRNAVEILRQPDAPADTAAWAREIIDRQVRQVVRLVDDLLDVSRVTRGKIGLRRERLVAGRIVADAVETSRPLVEQRGHRLTVTLPAEPLWLDADPTRLAQVLANLLNNAAKYTPDGGDIALTVEAEDDEVAFRVRDTGVGIPGGLLRSVFDPFTQLDPGQDRASGGLGIGLTLVKRLAELHGGRVRAHSNGPGQGSEFTVWLPRADAPRNGDVSSAAPAASGRRATPRRVLVVEDNRDAAESLATLLRMCGHDVRTVHDGLEALSTAERFRPEVVLCDLGLPGLEGCEVVRRMRRMEGFAKVPMVALTGFGQEEDRRRAREAGFDRHFTKPVDPDDLLHLIDAAS